jgi:hypothetical protein
MLAYVTHNTPDVADSELGKHYPKLTDEELVKVERNSDRCLAIVLRIAEHAPLGNPGAQKRNAWAKGARVDAFLDRP